MRDAGQAADDEQVEMVERGGADAHAHVACPARARAPAGRRAARAVEPAVGGDGECSHACGRGLYCSRECYAGAERRERRARASLDVAPSRALMTAIKVPPLGESIVEATVSRWLKKEGDAVAAGDTLVELETDKITVEVPALTAGVLAKRARKRGRRRGGRRAARRARRGRRRGAAPAPAPRAAGAGASRGAAPRHRAPRRAERSAGAAPRRAGAARCARRPPRSAWRPSRASTSRRCRAPGAAAW